MADTTRQQRVQNNRRLVQTQKVLRSIAYHLSRNRDCKGLAYQVKINEHEIFLDVPAQLCMYFNGKRTNRKSPAIHHVMLNHFPELMEWAIADKRVEIHPNALEPGTYEYKPSVTGKSRRWFKVR